MENNRGSWNSNIGFLLAAIGSAVGLGNIWGFPYKMGKSGGFTFLLVYIFLAVFVGLIIMASELALGRKTRKAPIAAYKAVSSKYSWLGWFAVLSPFLIMTFYSVLGGYCIYYIIINLIGLFGGMPDGSSFGAMLTSIPASLGVLLGFMLICFIIVAGGVSGGIEKFNKIGMPALFVMLLVIIVRALTLPNAVEGLKFMFVPGYAVRGGFIEEAPSLITVLGTAGGQMFFSLSLAMGAMITYGSYLSKEENLVKNSGIIVFADTLVALLAGIAVIPAAVANGINNGIPVANIKLNGPGLLFSTLQDVFHNMGAIGGIFGVIFYLLVLIAAISSAISLMEVLAAHFIDKAAEQGKSLDRKKVVLIITAVITVFGALVAADGLGSNHITPAELFKLKVNTWNDCWLDFFDCWSARRDPQRRAQPLLLQVLSLLRDLCRPGGHVPGPCRPADRLLRQPDRQLHYFRRLLHHLHLPHADPRLEEAWSGRQRISNTQLSLILIHSGKTGASERKLPLFRCETEKGRKKGFVKNTYCTLSIQRL